MVYGPLYNSGFGASPAYIGMMEKEGVVPKRSYDYGALSGVFLTGSPTRPNRCGGCTKTSKRISG